MRCQQEQEDPTSFKSGASTENKTLSTATRRAQY